MHEAGDHFLALERMRHFGVELHGVETARFVGHRRDRAGLVAGDDRKAGRHFGDFVAVAHPHVEQAVPFSVLPVFDVLEQCRMTTGTDFSVAELTFARAFDLTAQLLGHRLHPVADAEDRHAEFENDLRRFPLKRFVYRVRSAREDDALRVVGTNEIFADVEGVQFAVNLLLAHTAGDQLGDLRAEVENKNFLVSHICLGALKKRAWNETRAACTAALQTRRPDQSMW